MKKKILQNKYMMVLLVSISVWLIANVINLLLFILVVLIQQGNVRWLDVCGLVLMCAALFSLPGIIVFDIVLLLCRRYENLFLILLITAILGSFFSVLLFVSVLDLSVSSNSAGLFCIAIFSAVGAAALHRPAFTAIQNHHAENLVHP